MSDLIDAIIAIFNAPAPVTIKLSKAPKKATKIKQVKKTPPYTSQYKFYKAVHEGLQNGNIYKNPDLAKQKITRGTYAGLWRVYSGLNAKDPVKENYFDTI